MTLPKYSFLLLVFIFVTRNNTFAQTTQGTPSFTGGIAQSLSVCENTPAISIDTLLAVMDTDAGDTETWSVITVPPNGTLIAAYTTTATGDTLVPTILSYTPNSGYNGNDSFKVSISNGYFADTTTVYITVNPLPFAGAIIGNAGVCAGDTTTLMDTPPGAGGIWTSSSSGIATIDPSSGTITGVSAGTATISYSVTTTCGIAVVSLPFTVNTVYPPVPAGIGGLHQVCAGAAVTVRDATTGGEWISGNPTIATVDPVSGNVTGIAAGTTTITYAEANFCASYYSIIPFSVDPVPSAIAGPAQLCIGNTSALSDTVTGGTWSSSATGIASINPYSGMATGISTGTAMITYTAGVAGCTTTTRVTVNVTPASFTVIGGGPYCAGGTGSSIGLSGSAPGISYQLFRTGVSTGIIIPGTGAVLDFGLQTLTGAYTVVATDTLSGCDKNMSGTITVSINPRPSAYTVTGGGSYCVGGTGYHVYLIASQSGVSYQLYNGVISTGPSFAGTGGALDFGLYAAAGIYTVVATNTTTGCTSTMSGSATITVNSNPVAFALIGGGNYCAGSTGVHIGLDSSITGIDYQLYNDGTAYSTPFSGTGIPLDFGLTLSAGLYTAVATNPATGCTSSMSGSVAVTVNPLPASFTITGGGHYCVGDTGVHVYLSNSATGITYQLYQGATATGSAVPGTDSVLNFELETIPGIYTVIATNATTNCIATMSGSTTITVDSLPSLYAVTGGGSYCAGGLGVYVDLSGSDLGTDYQLYNGAVPLGIPEHGSGGVLDLGLETAAGSYTVVATDPTTGCISTMAASATVIVNPVPATITGADSVYTGATTTLSDVTPGGTWSSQDTSLAHVNATGIVYGDTVGFDTIVYTLPTGCNAKVEVTVNYAPIDTTTTISIVSNQGNYNGVIGVFPNPTSGSLHIKWENQQTGNAVVVITDVAGREVYRSAININASSGQTQLQPDLRDGIYLLTIKSESISYSVKLVVE